MRLPSSRPREVFEPHSTHSCLFSAVPLRHLELKIPAAPPPGGISAMLRQACRETDDPPKWWGVRVKSRQSPKCKEVYYCNSLANPAAPMSGISASLQRACGECARCAFSRVRIFLPTTDGDLRYCDDDQKGYQH